MKTFKALLILGCLCACFGCGDDNSIPPPPTEAIPLPSTPPMAAPPTRTGAKPVGPRSTVKATKPDQEETPEITSNDYMLGEKPTALGVIRAADVPEQNLFAVALPRKDSSQVKVDQSKDDQETQPVDLKIRIKLPDGFSIPSDIEINERGFPDKLICDGDQAKMVLVSGGVFTQGSNTGDKNASPEHLTFVDPFYMDVTEVTLNRFAIFQAESQEAKPKVTTPRPPKNRNDDPQHPALGVPWKDALNYADFFGKTLPTEAEWERAARGKNGNLSPWGFGRPINMGSSLNEILPVASRPTDLTTTGIYDMAGNAREWVMDWYSSKAYEEAKANPGEPLRNPQGPRRAEVLGARVVKGSRDGWQLSKRGYENLKDSADDVGFRCILRITEEMILSEEEAISLEKKPVNPFAVPGNRQIGF